MNNSTYYYGHPQCGTDWKDIANIFSTHDSIHSEKTSSIPLLGFWHPSQLEERISVLNKKYHCITEPATFCFEYAVPVNKESQGRGKSSMTDLMILTKKHVVAVEGKYTECRQKYQKIVEWRGKKQQVNGNKYKVLKGWLKYIQDADKTRIKSVDEIWGSKTIPYQLVHRIASACKVAKDKSREPVVIYHLFYDRQLISKKDKFLEELKKAVNELKIKNLPFLILLTEVIPLNYKKRFGQPISNQIFQRLADNKDLYQFAPSSCEMII